ncbi:MAG: hypothetical protein H0W87_06925 [Actinobacteria bacterium]|nr:hypothetical protein [Actinomycetota bacterium]
MRRLSTTILCALAGLVLAGQALAGTTFGVADTRPVGMADDGAKFFDLMNDVGLVQDRLTVMWNPARPTQIPRRAELERAVQQATEHGVSIVFSVTQEKAGSLSGSPAAADQFAVWVALLANAFPDVTTFVIGNEFNQPKFFQPQFGSRCESLAGAAYMRVLAKSYDALHAVNPNLTVITSVSPRGNDACAARNNRSTSPVRFIHDMGVAYQAMHRDRPAFDEFGIHIYPNQSTDSIAKGYQWPKIGASNLDRLKQALWDAFVTTAQPVPDWQPAFLHYGQGVSALRPPKIWIGEIGWQVAVQTGPGSPYTGRESVETTSEANQAQIYPDLVRMMNCDPLVDGMLFYGFVDEPDLDRFQAGLLRADWTQRPSYETVKSAIAQAQSGCKSGLFQWHHLTSVLGGGVDFGKLKTSPLNQTWWGFSATAKEDAVYNAGIYKVDGRQLSQDGRAEIVRSLSGAGGPAPKLAARNVINAYWAPIVRFAEKPLPRGNYVYGIRIRAAMNLDRSRIFVSRPFQVGK